MNKFIKKLCLLLPIPINLVMVNYFVDPGNIFYKHGYYEKGIASILSKETNVENLSNYDERLLQKFYIDKLEKTKRIVVLGSSRAMQITEKVLKEEDMFNSSVSGASLEDLMAIYGVYKKENKLPKKVVIGLDPWILNKNNNQSRWKSLKEYYFYMQGEIGLHNGDKEKFDEKYLELVSLSYFQTAVDTLAKKENIAYASTDKEYSKTNVKRADGSLAYNEEFRNRSVEEVRKLALQYASEKPVYNLGDFTTIDKVYKENFEEFIALMLKDGVEVEFYLSPYHPYVYEKLISSADYRIVHEVERYFVEFAKDKDIKLNGSYNPSKVGCIEEDFYDGMHIKPSGVEKIFKNRF
ncbi:hypothetical protein GOM49_12690 [Clostridium bovifaecis]|uniref:Uncharacterized protein n=1 Tax=Clostridium bovifaecis TaxID=2184719 RepID=A0A6I6F665_9CLOT|nr:hypothetical protein GOM49_12690 [Clostridium bovifaecis]